MVNSNAIKAAIVKKGLTQSEVAEKIGISKQSFNYKILNKVEFKVDEVRRLCDVLDISSESLQEIFFAKKLD